MLMNRNAVKLVKNQKSLGFFKCECLTPIDFKNAYFHIPIQSQSRKHLLFHVQGQTFQFKAIPFVLSRRPMEFTVVAKEVKLIALHNCIRIYQYLDDWLVRARSHQTCLQDTQTLVAICQDLGWLVKMEKNQSCPTQWTGRPSEKTPLSAY